MYKKVFSKKIGNNKFLVHLWEDTGYQKIEWTNYAYKECSPKEATHKGLKGEPLIKTSRYKPDDKGLHFHDMTPHKKFLVEKYGTNDEPSVTQKELFFDL